MDPLMTLDWAILRNRVRRQASKLECDGDCPDGDDLEHCGVANRSSLPTRTSMSNPTCRAIFTVGMRSWCAISSARAVGEVMVNDLKY